MFDVFIIRIFNKASKLLTQASRMREFLPFP